MWTKTGEVLGQFSELAWPLVLDLAFDATVVLAAAILACVCLRRASAAARHRVWVLAAVSLSALPVVRLSVPSAPLALWAAPQPERTGESSEASGGASEPADVAASSARTHRPKADVLATDATEPGASADGFMDNPAGTLPGPSTAVSEPAENKASADHPTVNRGENTGRETGLRSPAVPWRSLLVALWDLGIVVGLAAFAASTVAGRRLVETGEPLAEPSWLLLSDEVAAQLGLRRQVRMVRSSRAVVPLTAGWLRPTIVLPAGCDRWPDQRRRVVLVHELSHVIRHDVLWQSVARLACVLHWFHPLVWLAARRLRVEREMACDDAVLLAGEQASDYASHLLELASAISGRLRQPGTAVAMARNSLQRRIRLILRPGLRRGPVGRAKGGLLAVGAAVVLVLAGAVSPIAATPRALAVAPKTGSSQAADTPAAPEGRKIAVRIVDQAGRPIAGAQLSAAAGSKRTKGQSDANGMVEIPLSEERPGDLLMMAKADGYVPVAARWEDAPQLDPIPSQFTLKLPRGTTIGGIVQDEQGRPIAGAEVVLRLPADSLPGGRTTLGIWDLVVTTDAQGRWRSNQMPSALGNLRITLRHSDHVSDATYQTQMPTIEQLRNQSAVMVMQEGHVVTGTVTDADGKPLAGAIVGVGRSLSASGPRTAKTDQQGHFRFEHVGPRDSFLWAFSAGWAPRRIDLAPGPGLEPLQVRLERGRTVRVRIVDQKDQPLGDALVLVSDWLRYDIAEQFGLSMRTDREGRWTWTWAPKAELKLEVHKQGYVWGSATIPPDRKEEMVLKLLSQRKVTISGRVTDAQTGKPVEEFFATPSPSPPSTVWQRRPFRNPEGRYELAFDDRSPVGLSGLGLQVRIEAEDYGSRESRGYPDEQGAVALDFKLAKGTGPQGVVRLPDGKPAVGAQVFVSTRSRPMSLRNGSPSIPGNWPRATTGPDGRFTLGPQTAPFGLVVFHEQGYAEVGQKELANSPEITLQRWARLEGTLSIGSRPAADQEVSLHYLSPDPRRREGAPRAMWEYQTKTDAEGRFTFEQCVPGIASLSRMYVISALPGGARKGLTHHIPVDLLPGKTTTVSVGGTGRAVLGHVVMPEGEHRKVDWTAQNLGAGRQQSDYPYPPELKEPPAEVKDLRGRFHELGDTPESRALAEKWNQWVRRRGEWLQQWRQTEEGKASQTHYAAALDAEGRFRIEDVPAGNFELTMTVYPPSRWTGQVYPPNQYERIGDVKHQFTVPEMPGGRSDQPLDLGEIRVILNDRLKPGDQAPDFEINTLSGKPLRLSSLRGKYVVLEFWRGPEHPIPARLQYLKTLYRRFAENPKLAFVGLSLIVDLDAQRQYMQKQEIPWTQGLLDPESKVLSDYGSAGVPHLLLIGPDGTILRRGIEPAELAQELEGLLPQPE